MLTVRTRAAISAAVVAALAVAVTVSVMDRWNAVAAPGDDDATFVPTAGCRLTDTRQATNVGPRATALGPGETMEVSVHGSNGECTGPLAIPADATAVALNATVVDATAASNIRLFPADLADVPLLSNLNVTAGAPPTPNKVDVELSPDGRLKVFNFQGAVNVVLDVVGFYAPTSLRTLAAQAGTPGPTGPQGPPGPPGPAGEVVMSHGMGPTLANTAQPPGLVQFLELVRVDMPVAGTYQSHLPLTGPVTLGGAPYALSSIEYCVRFPEDVGTVTRVSVVVNSGSRVPILLTSDGVDRTEAGCYTVDVGDDTARNGVRLGFETTAAGPKGAVDFVGVSSTWTPLL